MNSLTLKLLLIFALVASAPLSATTLCATKDGSLYAEAPVPGESLPQKTSRLVLGKTYVVIREGAGWVLLDVNRVPLWTERQNLGDENSCRTKSITSPAAPIKSSPTNPTLPTKPTPQKSESSSSTSCLCGTGHVCVGPRGGRYCITSGGNKRYGV